MDTFDLKARTIDRNPWKDLTPVAYMGIQGSVDETTLDSVNKNLVQTVVDIVDDAFRIKEEQLLNTIQLEYDKIATEKAITDAKAVTSRTLFALTAITNNYFLATEHYVLAVKRLLMDAQEYGYTIEQKRIALGLLTAEIAEERVDVKIAEIDMKVELEAINKKFVEVDVVKAELNAAKADVKLVLAEVAIEEAKIEEIEARVALVMTDVEKAKLTADIARIFAEIAVKELTERKYDVEKADILAEYNRIADKLASVLVILTLKESQLSEQNLFQGELLTDVAELLIAKKDLQLIKEEAAETDLDVKAYEETIIAAALRVEEGLKTQLLSARELAEDQRKDGVVDTDAAILAAEAIVKYYDSHTSSVAWTTVHATAEIARAISRV